MTDRTIDPAIRADIESAGGVHALLAFLTITHPQIATPIRVVSDAFDYVMGGETFTGIPFDYQLLSDSDQAPTSTITVQNVDRRIGEALRNTPTRAQVMLELRSTADFNLSVVPRTETGSSPLYAFEHFELVQVTADEMKITAQVFIRDFSQEPWPGKRATLSRCPGLFR